MAATLLIAIYVVMMALSLVVLWRLLIILPILTNLATQAQSVLRRYDPDGQPPERRLLEIEDLFRLQRITQDEYTTKRQDILNEI